MVNCEITCDAFTPKVAVTGHLLSRRGVVAKECSMWPKAFLRSSCAAYKGLPLLSLARSRTETQCDAFVLRRKSVWNELHIVSPIASSQMYRNSFFIVDKKRNGLEFRQLARKRFSFGVKLAATVVDCVSISDDVNMSLMDCVEVC